MSSAPTPEASAEGARLLRNVKQSPVIDLRTAEPHEFVDLKSRLQEAFTQSVIEEFGDADASLIPLAAEVNACFSAPHAEVLQIFWEGTSVGGAVISIYEGGVRGALDFFFLDRSVQGTGVGYAAWCAIEKRYPSVQLWETDTRYFEKRNIHFYVNKCGFHIVEFFHPGHPDREHSGEVDGGPEYMFHFEKAL